MSISSGNLLHWQLPKDLAKFWIYLVGTLKINCDIAETISLSEGFITQISVHYY